MKIQFEDGKIRNVVVETYRIIGDDYLVDGNIREPTNDEVKDLMSNPCDGNHRSGGKRSVYDEPGFGWITRYCAKCGEIIDSI